MTASIIRFEMQLFCFANWGWLQSDCEMTNHTRTSGLLSVASSAIDSLGLRRSRTGRRLIAGLNVVGERAARLLYLHGKRPLVVDGHKMFLSDRHAPSFGFVSSMVNDRYEVEIKDLLHDLIRPGMTVFDVGAHVGYYTLMAARLVGPSGRVYAFEAEPENYAILKKNVELNGYTNVTCIPKAVSNQSGVLTLYVSSQGNDRHTIINDPRAISLGPKREVPAITLDEFAASVGWPQVDVIKMDVEGAEPMALVGMSRLLDRSENLCLVMEFAPEIIRSGGTDPIDFLRTLTCLGIKITPVESDLSQDLFRPEQLLGAVNEAEKRGAINLLCKKRSPTLASAGAESGLI